MQSQRVGIGLDGTSSELQSLVFRLGLMLLSILLEGRFFRIRGFDLQIGLVPVLGNSDSNSNNSKGSIDNNKVSCGTRFLPSRMILTMPFVTDFPNTVICIYVVASNVHHEYKGWFMYGSNQSSSMHKFR